jgi:hypothetical protein
VCLHIVTYNATFSATYSATYSATHSSIGIAFGANTHALWADTKTFRPNTTASDNHS